VNLRLRLPVTPVNGQTGFDCHIVFHETMRKRLERGTCPCRRPRKSRIEIRSLTGTEQGQKVVYMLRSLRRFSP
jgi:hypothetical protein